MKHLLKMSDLTPGEVTHILDVADQLKAQQKAGGTPPLLAGKSVALMFSKNSTRTRNSFEVGVYQLGGLITGEVAFNAFTVVAVIVLVGYLYALFRPDQNAKHAQAEREAGRSIGQKA